MNIAYAIDWRRPGREEWRRPEVQTTTVNDVELTDAATQIAYRYHLKEVPIVREGGYVIRVRAWQYTDWWTEVWNFKPADREPDSVWTYDPTAA